MKNILITTDLTLNCDRALERAVRLAKDTGANLHVLHVAQIYHLPGKKRETEALKRDTENLIRSYLAGYTGAKAVKTKIYVINGGDPFAQIITHSQKLKADVIVMGMHEKVGFRDLFVGTTIERVVRKGIKPVLMVKDKPKGTYKSVMAGTDFSDASKRAFYFALELAPKAKFSLVHCNFFSDTHVGSRVERSLGDIIEGMDEERLTELTRESEKVLEKHSIPLTRFSCKAVKGRPFEVLTAEAKKEKTELLAIGAHDRPSLSHTKLGGVAEDILANPPCDVLVMKTL